MIGLAVCGMIVVFLSPIQSQVVCDVGWFGPNCQYQSQCAYGNDADGSCKSPKCRPWWGGYKCQYYIQDLVGMITVSSENTVNPAVWSDSDDNSCVSDGSITSISMTPRMKVPFFFIRLAVKDEALLYSFKVFFEETYNNTVKRVPCERQAFTAVSPTVVDIRCEYPGINYKLVLEGKGVTGLCSIYLTIGRNVALKQSVQQSSTNGTYSASNAVDGNNEGNGARTNNGTDQLQTWTLTLDEPVVVGGYRVYSPAEYYSNSRLHTFDKNDVIILDHSLYDTHIFIENGNRIPIKRIEIIATKDYLPTRYLNLYEVIIFGSCPPGKWGLDCKQQCDIKCPDFCSEWDGSCPTACLGYLEPGCIDGNVSIPEESSLNEFSLGIGLGVGVGCLLLVIVLILVIRGYMSYRNAQKKTPPDNPYLTPTDGPTDSRPVSSADTLRLRNESSIIYDPLSPPYSHDEQLPEYNYPIFPNTS